MKQLRVFITGSGTGDLTGLTTTTKTSVVSAINEVNGKTATVPDATVTQKGVIEIATLAEVATGTDTVRAVTPEGVRQERAAVKAEVLAVAASETVVGHVELATLAEVATGTDAVRAVTPQGVRQERLALKAEILGVGVPAALDTLDELAAALGDDANFASTVTTGLGNRLRVDTAAQGLTATQQLNGRTNLDVYSKAELGDPETNLVALYTTAKA